MARHRDDAFQHGRVDAQGRARVHHRQQARLAQHLLAADAPGDARHLDAVENALAAEGISEEHFVTQPDEGSVQSR